MSGPYRKPAERPTIPRDLKRWYTKAGGPFDTGMLIESVRDGYITKSTLVRAEDEHEWRALSEVVAFAPLVVRVPPRKQTRHSKKRTEEHLDMGGVSGDALTRILGGLSVFGVGAVGTAVSSHVFLGAMVAGLSMMAGALRRRRGGT